MCMLYLQMFIIYEWDIFNGMHAHFFCLFDFLEVMIKKVCKSLL